MADIRRSGNPSAGYRYQVSPILTNYSVHSALQHPYSRDPAYVAAVIGNYIANKRSRGKHDSEIAMKLNVLERELPLHLPAFIQQRREYGLNDSPWARTATAPRHIRAASNASSLPRVVPLSRTTTAPARQQSTDAHLPAEFRVRREQNEDDPPPPPYAKQDPEPEQTRILEERLAAEQAGRLPVDVPSTASGSGSGSAPAPTPSPSGSASGARASPARSTSGFASGAASGSGSGSGSATRRGQTPPGSPPRPAANRRDSEELRRAVEESEFEAAKRASLIAEQERKDMEEAILLSVQESARMSSDDGGGGGGGGGGGWGNTGPSGNRSASGSGHVSSSGSARASGDWGTTATGTGSSTGDQRHSNGNGYAYGTSTGWQGEPQLVWATPPTDPRHSPAPSGLMDDDSTGMDAGPAPLVPQKTGAVIQSRNPFLAASEGYSETQLTPPRTPPSEKGKGKQLPRPPSLSLSNGQADHGSPGASRMGIDTGAGAAQTPSPRPLPTPGITYTLPTPVDAPPYALNGVQAGMGGDGAGAEKQTREKQAAEEEIEEVAGGYTFLVDDGAAVTAEAFADARRVVGGLTSVAGQTGSVDVYFVNSKRVGKELQMPDDVEDLFAGLAPRGEGSLGARLRGLEGYVVVVTTGAFAHSIAQRQRQLRFNPSLTRDQLLGAETADDVERVLLHRTGRTHFLQLGGDQGVNDALSYLSTLPGVGTTVYTSLSEEFVEAALGRS